MDNVTYNAPEKGYIKLHNDMVFDTRLSDKDIRLFIMMASMPGGITFTTEGFPLLHKVRALKGFSRESVKRSLTNLKQCGYVKYTPSVQANGKIFGGTYSLFGVPTNHKLKNELMAQTAQKPLAQIGNNEVRGSNFAKNEQNVGDKAFSANSSNCHELKSELQDKELDIDKKLEDKKKDILRISKEKEKPSNLPPCAFQFEGIWWHTNPELPF